MISVVIISHNREPAVLERAVNSVLNQSYHDVEIIVVNDSSADFEKYDMVRKMINDYQMRFNNIFYIEHPKPSGACAARNTGLERAVGEYVAFLDDDDEWDEDKLAKQLKKFDSVKNPDLALVSCGFCFVYDGEDGRESLYQGDQYRGNVLEKLLEDNFIYGASFPLMRTDAVRELGGFDVRFPSCQDWELWLRIAQKWEVDYCNEPLVRYHVHGGEQITKSRTNQIRGLELLIEKNKKNYTLYPKAYAAILKRLLYQYAIDRNIKKSLSIISSISELRQDSIPTLLMLYVRIFKWYICQK